MTPLLGVSIPVRNGEEFLAQALDSVLAQTRADVRCVVFDNASDDGTADICRDYASRDDRVSVVRSETVLTQVQNMNRAVVGHYAHWVKLLCHDDLLSQDCLETIQQVLADPRSSEAVLIGHPEHSLYSNGYRSVPRESAEWVVLPPVESVRRWFAGASDIGVPAISTATVKRSSFLAAGEFDGRYKHFDTFMWLRMMMDHPVVFIDRPLSTTRIHGAQVSVMTRTTLREVDDYRQFVPEFLSEYGDRLQLDRRTVLRARAKPFNVAALSIAAELLCRRYRKAFAMVRHLPAHWLPFVLPLTGRAVASERARTRVVSQSVPYPMIYPG
jgi:glycosyltransferase involved in cell wall biosynthesis